MTGSRATARQGARAGATALSARRELAILVVCTCAILAPFLGRALHMDDPLFVWTARQVLVDPFDFYGFTVNWYGREMPMSAVAMNPPLFGYLLALAALLFGWQEPVLHATNLLLSLAALTGVWRLARAQDANGLLAALLTLATPFFVVSAATLMCDMLMLAAWIWALVHWRTALQNGSRAAFLAAVLLVIIASLGKYFGVSAILLMALQTLLHRGGQRRRAAVFLAIGVAALAAMEFLAWRGDGHGLLTRAAGYASDRQPRSVTAALQNAWVGLVFTGGGLLAFLCAAPLGGSLALRRVIGALLVVLVAASAVISVGAGGLAARAAQQVLFGLAGGLAVLLVLDAARRDPSADTLVLAAWFLGTLVFACWVNWTINARSLLALVPPWSILVARAWEPPAWRRGPLVLLAAMACISLAVGLADARQADAGRTAARELTSRYGNAARVWFQGHWGFQYYMQERGARALDVTRSEVAPADIIVVPPQGTNVRALSPDFVRPLEVVSYPMHFLPTMSQEMGAGLYSHTWGSMPFVFAASPPEVYVVLQATRGFRMVAP